MFLGGAKPPGCPQAVERSLRGDSQGGGSPLVGGAGRIDACQRFRLARSVIDLEKATGMFVEADVQRALMGHETLVALLNQFYMSAHWIVTPLFFVWL